MTIEKIQCVADCVRYHAERQPDKVATMFDDRITTYADLDTFSSRVANGLIAEGIKPQDRVAYLGKNSDLYAQLQMGISKAGAVVTPVNWRLAAPEVKGILNHSDARILFLGDEFVGMINKIKGELQSIEKIIVMEEATADYQDYASWRDAQSDTDPMVPISGEDICFQLYTSGTTGTPKGVMLKTEGVFAGFEGIPGVFPEEFKGTWREPNEGEVSLLVAPNFHLSGNGNSYLTLREGGTLLIHPDFDIERILSDIEKYKISRGFMVPAMMKFVIDRIKKGAADLSSLRVITYGASPIPPELMKEVVDLIGCGFVQMYGMTEIGTSCTFLEPEDHLDFESPRLKSCGKAGDIFDIKICDPSTGADLATGEIGEVVIRTPTLMAGYYKNPEATEKVIKDGWYYSGDAGYLDEDGFLYIVDRLKDMVVSGGENIYCAEVESALAEHPAVAEAAVIGVPSEKWGEEVKALVRLEPNQSVSEVDLITFTRELLAGYKVPKSIEFREELPRNPSGKLLKNVLREPYWKDHERRVG